MRRPAALPKAYPTAITVHELSQDGAICHREGRPVLRSSPSVLTVRGEPAIGLELRFCLVTGASREWPGRFRLSPISLKALHKRLKLASMDERQLALF